MPGKTVNISVKEASVPKRGGKVAKKTLPDKHNSAKGPSKPTIR